MSAPDQLEEARLRALKTYCVLDTPAEKAFDDLAVLASQVCDTPFALITLIEQDRQWFKATVGLDICQADRDATFCQYVLRSGRALEIPDTLLDPRFVDNPFVVQNPNVRFYAGVPLVTEDGLILGTLCVLDTEPRRLNERQHQQLHMLAGQVMDQLSLRRKAQEVIESELALSKVARVISDIQTGTDARQTVVDAAVALGHAAFVSLVQPGATAFQVTATNVAALAGVEIPMGDRTMTGQVFETGTAVFVADPATHPMISAAILKLTNAESMYFVPVRAAETTLGVLLVAWREAISGLDDRRARAVALLADHAGVALHQAALMAELESLALTDSLTDLPNRRNWDQLLTLQLAHAKRTQAPLTIALADLDHFKRFNDTLGHPAGDALLRAFAEAARGAVRDGDLVARWGGEEFAFALPNCSPAEAHRVLERVRKNVPLLQTCSIGFAVWDGAETAAELLHRADQALYEVKQNGRNRVHAA